MNRPFDTTMDTHTECAARNSEENYSNRVTSINSLTSSLTGSNQNLSGQSNPSSSQTLRGESTLSNTSKISSINNNARTTTGKNSNHGSSLSSTPELSNRSLLSSKEEKDSLSDRSILSAEDYRESKTGHREPGRNSTNNISMTPDRLSRSSLRHGQYSDEDERKQLSKTREVDTPNRESTRTPLASHGAEKKKKQNQEVVKKKFKADGNENKLEKRKQDIVPKKRLNGKTPSRLPVPCQNQKRKLEISAKPSVKITESTTAVRTKNTVNKIKRNDTSKNIQISNTREKDSAVPKACPTKAGNGKTTKFPRRAPIKGASQENPKLQDTKAKKSFMPTASDGTSKPRSFTTRKQYNHSLPKTVAEAEGLLHLQKEASKATIPTVEPIANSAALPKAVAEGKGLLRLRHKKEESTGDISTAGQDFNSAKDIQDSALDASQIDRYFKLLDEFNENENKIEENQRKIVLQEKEMDEIYARIRNETENLAECTEEVVQLRKIHKNYKDEAARIRVHHKTNILAADIYEAANIDLQIQIAEIHQEISEIKAINDLKPEDFKAKIEEVSRLFDNQRQTNASLEEEIEKLKTDLNAYRCGEDSLAKPQNEAINMIHEELEDNSVVRSKDMPRAKGMTVGESKSADVVSLSRDEAESKETKSEHRQGNRFQKIINSVRALLPDRKQKLNNSKEVDRTQTPTPDTPKLLQKRHQNDAENNTHYYLKPTGHLSEELKPTNSLTLEGTQMTDTQKKSYCFPFTKKPVLHKRRQHNTGFSNGNGISSSSHAPHPPVSPCPETTRVRNLRTTTHTLKPIYK